MSKERLNIELFKKIREKIAATPEAYDQETYGRREEEAPCGTAACIAGWACVLSDRVPLLTLQRQRYISNLDIPFLAAEALNLTVDEADILFSGNPDWDDGAETDVRAWPEPYASDWSASKTLPEITQLKEQARIAVAYLDRIIETGKVLE